MASPKVADNGHSTSIEINGEAVILPTSVSVGINGAVISAPGKPKKDGTSYWYEARQIGTLNSDPRSALEAMQVTFEGEPLNRSESGVHLSAQRKRKDGSLIPNTGGNFTVTHSAIVNLGESQVPFTVQATATVVTRKKGKADEHQVVVVAVKAFRRPSPRTAEPVGSVEGELTF